MICVPYRTKRVVESITVKYKNLDGSLHEKRIDIHNSIDWHLPLFISQSYHTQTDTPQKKKLQPFTKILSLPFISFFTQKKRIKLVTHDAMLRNFLLVKPHRIVCDFQKSIDIRSYEKRVKTKGSYFKKIRIGEHKDYYRVVIELDGFYRYRLKKVKEGYIFELL